MKHGRLVLVAALALMLCSVVLAQAPPAGTAKEADTTTSSQARPAPVVPPAAVDAAHFSADAATNAYMATMSPAARARSDAYYEGGYWLLLWNLLVALIVAWIFLATGLAAGLRDWAERLTRFRWLQTALVAALYILISTVLTLPWDVYTGYFREHQYGLSNLTLGAWLGEQGKGLAIALILGTVALTAIYAVLRRAPRTWWLWGSLVAVAFLIFAAAIAPVYIEPVFNKSTPLAESPLKEKILSMARANGVPATDVYEIDESRQSKRLSAHVSGLLGTTRISLNDNLMNQGSNEEIEAVLGHEMGHYVLNHVYKGITYIALLIVAGFAFVRWSFAKVLASRGTSWRVRGIGDVAGLPLLMVLLSIFFFLATPIENTISRTMEAEADNYGLNVARQPDGFAQAALALSEYRKMKPGPLEEFIFYDHPSGWNRIHRAMVWKAEHLNDPDIAAYDAAHQPRASTAE